MNLFFTENIHQNTAILTQEEARHCTQVLRKNVGDTIHFVDGKGGFYEGNITTISKKECTLQITQNQQNYQKPPAELHIAIAPTKNINRLEWFLEKCTEFGISSITPIRCQRSERKHIRIDRLEKIVKTAMKQSLKAYLPKIHPLTPLNELIIQQNSSESRTFMAHCAEGEKPLLQAVLPSGKDVTIFIGPEGDFSPEEIQFALQNNVQAVSLGTSRLRTETAGIAACHIFNLKNA